MISIRKYQADLLTSLLSGGRRMRNGGELRKKMIEAAIYTFSDLGAYTQARDIADRVPTNRANLSTYFGKNARLRLLGHVHLQFWQRLITAIEDPSTKKSFPTIIDRIDATIENVYELVQQEADLVYAVMTSPLPKPAESTKIMEAHDFDLIKQIRELQESAANILITMIKEAQKKKEISKRYPPQLIVDLLASSFARCMYVFISEDNKKATYWADDVKKAMKNIISSFAH